MPSLAFAGLLRSTDFDELSRVELTAEAKLDSRKVRRESRVASGDCALGFSARHAMPGLQQAYIASRG